MQKNSTKTSLRAKLRRQRKQLSQSERDAAARTAGGIVRQRRLIAAGRRVAAYWPFDGELDSSAIIEYAWAMRAKVVLPVVSTSGGRELKFAPYTPGSDLQQDRYGIPAPICAAEDLLSARQLDLILLPLVGFDRSGTRLGMGAGHYDATLSFLHTRGNWHRPRLIGIGYSFQEIDQLPREPWDVVMQGVVTDRQFIETVRK